MNKNKKDRSPKINFVPFLPDLITEEDYMAPPEEQKIRMKISVTENGVQILGDSIYASLLEKALANLGTDEDEIDRMLCG